MRTPKDWLALVAKGFAMGSADLVPGVSGGTIAFISGIYEELVSTFAGLGPKTVKDLFSLGIAETWKKYNISFLVALVVGIFIAAVALSGLIHHLQASNPMELRSFFFGLVIASTPLILKPVKANKVQTIVLVALGAAFAAWSTSLPPAVQSDSPIFLAISGAIAICAMILPGISGSFLLIILGAYSSVIAAIANFDIVRIAAFGGGIVVGILLFSRLLKKLLNNHKDKTLSILAGVMLGALGVLWPWKNNSEILFTHSDGRIEWITENFIPELGIESGMIALWALIGSTVITLIERIAKNY
jgi:putative membrane protein